MYEYFNEIKNPTLQAYNRYMFARNLFGDMGPARMLEYLDELTDQSRKNVALVASVINARGEEFFKIQYLSKIEPEDEDVSGGAED